jgi:hypothetical protein
MGHAALPATEPAPRHLRFDSCGVEDSWSI